jgi:hypothetical protein
LRLAAMRRRCAVIRRWAGCVPGAGWVGSGVGVAVDMNLSILTRCRRMLLLATGVVANFRRPYVRWQFISARVHYFE